MRRIDASVSTGNAVDIEVLFRAFTKTAGERGIIEMNPRGNRKVLANSRITRVLLLG
jgi:hypothetical protein